MQAPTSTASPASWMPSRGAWRSCAHGTLTGARLGRRPRRARPCICARAQSTRTPCVVRRPRGLAVALCKSCTAVAGCWACSPFCGRMRAGRVCAGTHACASLLLSCQRRRACWCGGGAHLVTPAEHTRISRSWLPRAFIQAATTYWCCATHTRRRRWSRTAARSTCSCTPATTARRASA